MDTITGLVASMRADLAAHADDRLWSTSGPELVEALEDIAALRAQLVELELRILTTPQVHDHAGACGATSTSAWWAHHTRQTVPAARSRAGLAADLDAHEETRAAMTRGDGAEDQATVILAAVDALPSDLEAGLVERAEKELITHAATSNAHELRRIGRTILDVVAPDIAEEHLRRQLDARKPRPPPTTGSPCPATGTAGSTAGSPSPRPSPRSPNAPSSPSPHRHTAATRATTPQPRCQVRRSAGRRSPSTSPTTPPRTSCPPAAASPPRSW